MKPSMEGFHLAKEQETLWYTSIDLINGYCHTFDINLNPKDIILSMKKDLAPVIVFQNMNGEEFTKVMVHDHLDMSDASLLYYAQTLPNLKGKYFFRFMQLS